MSMSRAEVVKIAAAQKLLLWVILGALGLTTAAVISSFALADSMATPQALAGVAIGLRVMQLVLLIFQIYAVVRLCLALNEGTATAIYVVVMCIPCVSLILLLFLNGRATARLKAAGIRVGLMGANFADVANYEPTERKCPGCGEAIDEAEARCPMCGKDVSAG